MVLPQPEKDPTFKTLKLREISAGGGGARMSWLRTSLRSGGGPEGLLEEGTAAWRPVTLPPGLSFPSLPSKPLVQMAPKVPPRSLSLSRGCRAVSLRHQATQARAFPCTAPDPGGQAWGLSQQEGFTGLPAWERHPPTGAHTSSTRSLQSSQPVLLNPPPS